MLLGTPGDEAASSWAIAARGAAEAFRAAAGRDPNCLVMRQQINGISLLTERIAPLLTPVWLFGAGHVGRALIKVLAELPLAITWVDSREAMFPGNAIDGSAHSDQSGTLQHLAANSAAGAATVTRLVSETPADEVADAPSGSYFLVMTHNHDLDLDICRAILRRSQNGQGFAWAGLIGSETKAARFRHKLATYGFSAAQIAQLTCPIGIAGIHNKLPQVIAIAVAAQLLQALQATQTARSADPSGSTSGLPPAAATITVATDDAGGPSCISASTTSSASIPASSPHVPHSLRATA
jgi:xanthine dehydrogenase accessory protein XdhC